MVIVLAFFVVMEEMALLMVMVPFVCHFCDGFLHKDSRKRDVRNIEINKVFNGSLSVDKQKR